MTDRIKRGELLARPSLSKFGEETVKGGHASTILRTPVVTRCIRKLVGLSTPFTFWIPFILNTDYFKFSFAIFNKHFVHLLSIKVLISFTLSISIILFDFLKNSESKGNFNHFEANYFSA